MIRTFLLPNVPRLVFSCFLCLAMWSTAVLAEPLASRGSFGFFGGVNVASLGGDFGTVGTTLASEAEAEFGGDWTSSTSSLTGLGLGAYYLMNLSPTFGLQIEGQYVQRGGSLDLTGSGIPDYGSLDMKTNLKFSYFEIPVLARYKGNPDAKVRPVLLGGLVFGLKVSSTIEVEAAGGSQSRDLSEGVNSLTFGLLGGAGVAFDVGETTALVIQARYYLGLTEPVDDSDFSTKSGDFGFFAGLEFPMGGKATTPEPTSESDSLPR